VLSLRGRQQYGFPIDGLGRLDGSRRRWDEQLAGMGFWNQSNECDILLHMLSITNIASGLKVTWQSVSVKTYFLQRSSNLTIGPAFFSIKSTLLGRSTRRVSPDTTLRTVIHSSIASVCSKLLSRFYWLFSLETFADLENIRPVQSHLR